MVPFPVELLLEEEREDVLVLRKALFRRCIVNAADCAPSNLVPVRDLRCLGRRHSAGRSHMGLVGLVGVKRLNVRVCVGDGDSWYNGRRACIDCKFYEQSVKCKCRP